MKKIIFAFIALALLSPMPADAASVGVYVTPKLGLNVQSKDDAKAIVGGGSSGLSADMNTSFSGGLAVGLDLQYLTMLPVRVEFEAMTRTDTSADNTWSAGSSTYEAKQDIGLTTYFVNAYYDFYTATPFTPYIGAGIGFASIEDVLEAGNFKETNESTATAFNVGFGVSWLLVGDFTLDANYRYIYPEEIQSNFGANVSKIRPTAHELLLGLRYTF